MNDSIRNQRGLSLVELLVSIALGLLLTVGALEMMLSSRNLHRATDTSSRMQENARFALDFLARDIRMAGYSPSSAEDNEGDSFFDDTCDIYDPCTEDGADTDSDRIAVLLNPENDRDCVGNTTTNQIANVYYLQTVDDVSSLYCRGYDTDTNAWVGSGQPLVDGVENMQFLYGISEDGDATITQYTSANNVTDWAYISAVKISLLVNNGQAQGNSQAKERTFNLLDAPPLTLEDNHDRQIFTTTIAVNNILYNEVNE